MKPIKVLAQQQVQLLVLQLLVLQLLQPQLLQLPLQLLPTLRVVQVINR